MTELDRTAYNDRLPKGYGAVTFRGGKVEQQQAADTGGKILDGKKITLAAPPKEPWPLAGVNLNQELVSALIKVYLRYLTGSVFIPAEHFKNPPWIGYGELQPEVKTQLPLRLNRRVEYLVFERVEAGLEWRDISLGRMRVFIEAYLSGYVGANAHLSAELGFDVKAGLLLVKGMRKGSVEKMEPARKKHSVRDKITGRYKEEELNVKQGVSASAGAFAGAKAELGCKGKLEWKAVQQKTCLNPVILMCEVKNRIMNLKMSF